MGSPKVTRRYLPTKAASSVTVTPWLNLLLLVSATFWHCSEA